MTSMPTEPAQHYPNILPVTDGQPRPLWSVMIPTYNCANYLRETLASVLAQDPGPDQMQIEVVDDCSTKDDPEAMVRELGQGRVAFYRQPKNVGHTGNFATCLQRSRGLWVHQLHGDDYIRPGFYAKIKAALQQHPDAGAAFCRTIFTNKKGHWVGIGELEKDEPGILENFAERIGAQQRIQTASIVVKRSIYEQLGGFDNRLSWSEDWEMWVRIAVHYPIAYDPAPLAVYRDHDSSSTHNKRLTGENIRDVQRCIAIIIQHFPPEAARRVQSQAKRVCANYALGTMHGLLKEGNQKAAFIQLRGALKCDSSPYIILRAARMLSLHFAGRALGK